MRGRRDCPSSRTTLRAAQDPVSESTARLLLQTVDTFLFGINLNFVVTGIHVEYRTTHIDSLNFWHFVDMTVQYQETWFCARVRACVCDSHQPLAYTNAPKSVP